MELPLSKREWDLYHELKKLFIEENQRVFPSNEYNKYDEWLSVLCQKNILNEIRANGATIYRKESAFEEFELWLKDQNRKAKRISKREWRIGIVSAIIGALIGAIVPLLLQMLI